NIDPRAPWHNLQLASPGSPSARGDRHAQTTGRRPGRAGRGQRPRRRIRLETRAVGVADRQARHGWPGYDGPDDGRTVANGAESIQIATRAARADGGHDEGAWRA